MNPTKKAELREAVKCILASWAITMALLIPLAGMMYAFATEIPIAIDREASAYDARVMARCAIHGDYNMADAFCRAAAQEKGQ